MGEDEVGFFGIQCSNIRVVTSPVSTAVSVLFHDRQKARWYSDDDIAMAVGTKTRLRVAVSDRAVLHASAVQM